MRRLRSAYRERLWPLAVALSLGALAVVLVNRPHLWVGDNRFELYQNPARRIARSLEMWDVSRGLGRVREDFWPGVTLPNALLRWFGLDAATTEHLFHALLLAAAGVGMVALLRLFRPFIGPEHAVAGLVYMFGTYSATFLVPSLLYVNYALAPWLAVTFYRGIHSRQPWRWAAAFALLLFLAGNGEFPGLVYASVDLVLIGGFVLLIDRSARPAAVLGWLLRAGLLVLVVDGPALYKTWVAMGNFQQKLADTELPEVLNANSSWAESWRGVGFWLAYFRDHLGLSRPQGLPYFEWWPQVLATFVAPLLALGALWLGRSRARILFGALMIVGLVLMVGAHPIGGSSPYGRLLLAAYDRIGVVNILRNNFKAGAGLWMGVSGLAGLGFAGVLRWVSDRAGRGGRISPWRAAAATLICAGLLLSARPFWSGQLYDPNRVVGEIPEYVTDAFSWLDAQPGSTRVLVLPGSWRNGFRWGWVNDDVLDSMLRRPHVTETAVPLSTERARNLLRAIELGTGGDVYSPGSLAPIARRLGVEYVMIRNDIRWEDFGQPRPSLYDRLRSDPDLALVETFGEPGENTTAPGDRSADAASERELPPIEIYQLADPAPPVQVRSAAPPLLVSGDGFAWWSLAEAGLLDGPNGVRYTADLRPSELAQLLEQGSQLIVTDTNRRRLSVVTTQTEESWLLAEDEDLERPTQDLFGREGSQSVAWYPDASRVTVNPPSRSLAGFRPWYRPSNAVDGDPSTAWLTGPLLPAVGRSLEVQLREPVPLDRLDITPASVVGGRQLATLRVTFPEGDSVFADFAGSAEPVQIRFPERSADRLVFTIERVVGGDRGSAGIAEIELQGVDLREFVQLPDDVFRQADGSADLAAALEDAPISYEMVRELGFGPVAEEQVLRRRFRTVERAFDLTGELQLSEDLGELGVAQPVELLAEMEAREATEGVSACHEGLISIDGAGVPVRLAGGVDALRGGAPVRFEGCAPLALGEGWHLLEGERSAPVNRLLLSDGATDPVVASPVPVVGSTVVSPELARVRIRGHGEMLVVNGQGWAPGWAATVDGVDVGSSVPIDTLNGWMVPVDGEAVVEISYRPQRTFEALVGLSGAGIVACGWLMARRRREEGG